jgi:hypothetical protein
MRIVAVVAVLGAVAAALFYVRALPDPYQGSDEAIIEIDTLHAIRGLTSGSVNGVWTLGPYSRYGWRHPGPLYFYVLAPIYAAGGFTTAALKLGVFLINVSCLGWIGRLLSRHVAPAPRLILFAVIAVFAFRTSVILTSVWNPHAVILPFAASVVLAAIVGSGRSEHLPGLALATSFVTETNVALVPVSAAIVATSLALLYRHHTVDLGHSRAEAWRLSRGPLLRAAALSLVLWAPSLFEQLHSRNGNLGQLLAFFMDSHHRGQYAIDAWRAWADNMSAFLRWSAEVPWGSPLVVTTGWPATLLAAGIVCALYLARTGRPCGKEPVLRALASVLVVGSLVALWSCTRIEDAINDYGVFWISVVGMLGVGVLGSLAALWLADRFGVPEWPRAALLARVGVLACAVVVAGAGVHEFDRQFQAAERRVRLEPVLPKLVSGLRLYMISHDIRRPVLDIRDRWGDAAGVLLNLYRRGQRVAVNADREFMFGPPFRRGGTEDREFQMAAVENHQELAMRPGDIEVVGFGETCIHTIEPERIAGRSGGLPSTAHGLAGPDKR